jgi:methyl-accepting chemotaxis protein
VQEMLDRMGHVAGLIDNVAAICQESAAAAEEISAQSHEVSGAMEHIVIMTTARGGDGAAASEAESLTAISDRLGRLVAGFRV